MQDVIVCHASADREAITPLVSALEARGHSIRVEAISGEADRARVETGLGEARAVLLLWSPAAVNTRDIARLAKSAGNLLLAVRLKGFGYETIPAPFNRLQTPTLEDTQRILALVDNRVRPAPVRIPQSFQRARSQLPATILAVGLGVIVMAGASLQRPPAVVDLVLKPVRAAMSSLIGLPPSVRLWDQESTALYLVVAVVLCIGLAGALRDRGSKERQSWLGLGFVAAVFSGILGLLLLAGIGLSLESRLTDEGRQFRAQKVMPIVREKAGALSKSLFPGDVICAAELVRQLEVRKGVQFLLENDCVVRSKVDRDAATREVLAIETLHSDLIFKSLTDPTEARATPSWLQRLERSLGVDRLPTSLKLAFAGLPLAMLLLALWRAQRSIDLARAAVNLGAIAIGYVALGLLWGFLPLFLEQMCKQSTYFWC